MKKPTNIIFCNVLLFVALLISGYALANEPPKGEKIAAATQKQDTLVPELADIIPLSAKLSGRFAELKNNIKKAPDTSIVDQEYARIATDLKDYTRKLNQLKKTDSYNLAKIYALNQAVANQKNQLEDIGKPLIDGIRLIDDWKTQWLSEKVRWDNWQSFLLKDHPPEQLKLAFKKIDQTYRYWPGACYAASRTYAGTTG